MNEDLSTTSIGTRNNENDQTGEQLIAYWTPRDHSIRSHRAPRRRHPRFVAATLTTALALGVVGGSTNGTFGAAYDDIGTITLSAPADIVVPEIPFTTLDEERRRREDRARVSRDQREQVASQINMLRTTVIRPSLPPRWVSPVAQQKITSCYGPRNGRTHEGIDFSASTGTKIRAVGPGVVVQAGWRYSGLGNSVVIKHGNGQMSVYGHASQVLVRTGQRVSAGASVALVGSTGNSTGPHLHFGFARTDNVGAIFDKLTNPAPWLRGKGVSLNRC